jgi:hypothetical protein
VVELQSNARFLAVANDGAEHFPAAALDGLIEIRGALRDLPSARAGVRIHGIEALRSMLLSGGLIGSLAAAVLGQKSRPVRAILFDKTAETNWALGWHQDRTICVKRRIEVEGYGPWTTKGGMQHVAPPFSLLARMVTLRVHLDNVEADNAPLLIAPGSHTAGRVPVSDYAEVVRKCGTYACLADAGDVWLYSTPILHASRAASVPRSRRVLQIDYSADEPAGGLEWLGI